VICIRLNDESFSYDIHSLVKAFYPAEDVKVISGADDIHSDSTLPEFSVYAGPEKTEVTDLTTGRCLHTLATTAALREDRAAYKSELKRIMYRILAEYTGRELPWGTLTGIRPTKLAMSYIEEAEAGAAEAGIGASAETGADPCIEPDTGAGTSTIPKPEIVDGIVRMYREKYLASEEKSRLAVDIAMRERRVLQDIVRKAGIEADAPNIAANIIESDSPNTAARRITGTGLSAALAEGYSLYIGIPFCPSTCLYCSFMSYPIAAHKKAVAPYIEALKREIDYVASDFAGRRLDSIYIGGGTPTTLTSEQLKELISYVGDALDLSHIREFTVEAGRADSIDREKLKTLRNMGVDRISVNPQTLNEDTLKLIGRKATAAETIEAYKLARDVGFDNINMDIILGLPGETIDDIRYTLDGIAELKPDDLTVHALSVKRGSKLAELLLTTDSIGREPGTAGNDTDVSLRNNRIDYDEAMRLTSHTAASIGLRPYYLYRQKNISGNLENTGYAREGREGIYNILMMEEVQDIVAVGAGTVSKRVRLQPDGNVRIDRCDTHKDLKLYLENTDEMTERKRRLFG